MQNKNVHKSGMGFVGTLTLLFIILKLLKVVSWSWFWVLSPIWMTLCLMIILFGAVLISGRLVKGKW